MRKLLLFAGVILCLSGCVSVNADIAVKPNGSGVLALEYRVPESLDGLGKLDGNEMYPTIPVGKTDFERSIKRIEGLSLVSFSEKAEKRDPSYGAYMVTTVKLKFLTLDALVRFLSATGQRAVYSFKNGINRLSLVVWEKWEENEKIDSDLLDLAAAVSEGCHFSLRFSVPQNAAQIRLVDVDGQDVDIGVIRADRVTIPMPALIVEKNGVRLEILW
ncbi:MAG: hypothetical protein LBG05_02280 [Treponema sp.]|jgi:hypothetical protein|nr:hypothetical protein [Treponema sp.]